MSSGAVAQAPAGGADEEQRQQNPWQNMASMVLRMGIMYAFMMFMRGGKKDDDTGVGSLDRQGEWFKKSTSPFPQRSDLGALLTAQRFACSMRAID